MPFKSLEEQRASQRLSQKKRYERDPSVREARTQWNRDNPEKAREAGKRAYAKLKARRKKDPLFDLAYRERQRAAGIRRREKANAQKRERYAADESYRQAVRVRADKWREENGRGDTKAVQPTWLKGTVPSLPVKRTVVHQPSAQREES